MLDGAFLGAVAAGTMRAATPVVFAGIGGVISERSGVINLGLEGLLLVGAWAGVLVQQATGNWGIALAAAAFAAALVGLLHAYFCVILRANQAVVGLALIFLCQGLTAVFGARLVGNPVSVNVPPPLAILQTIPVLGQILGYQDVMVFLALLAAALAHFFLFRTRWGLRLRACGESAAAASAAGIPVVRFRVMAGVACGALCGLGGAHLSLFYARQWQENMVAGRGWIALVMVIFGMWFPGRVVLGAYVFGGMATLQINLQAVGLSVPQYLLAMLPFVVTLVLLVLGAWRLRKAPGWMPADLGNAYEPEGDGR